MDSDTCVSHGKRHANFAAFSCGPAPIPMGRAVRPRSKQDAQIMSESEVHIDQICRAAAPRCAPTAAISIPPPCEATGCLQEPRHRDGVCLEGKLNVREVVALGIHERRWRRGPAGRLVPGGTVAQIYAIRAAIAKSIVAYHAKYVDESSKNELRRTLLDYDRNLLVSDPRRCEPKKYGGPSARARFQKSYR